jgi:hypothetical protein
MVADPIGDIPAGPNLKRVNRTLTDRLWWNLQDGEELYGPRDPRVVVMGWELRPGPLSNLSNTVGRKTVQLSMEMLRECNRHLIYKTLAHEVIHLLCAQPSVQTTTYVLEEGLCEVFASNHMRKYYPGVDLRHYQTSRYRAAERLVRRLLAIAPDAIRDLRKIEPHFDGLTVERLKAVAPAIDDDMAGKLAAVIRTTDPNQTKPIWEDRVFYEGEPVAK